MVNSMIWWNTFILYSLLGHFLETFFYPTGESGILYGPWTPIYGIGVSIILLFSLFFNKKIKWTGWKKFISFFLFGAIFLSFIEWCGGMLIEWIFHTTFWNYSHLTLSIGKYAAVEMGFVWGLGSILVIYGLQPVIRKIVVKIPLWLTILSFILFFTDLLISILFQIISL